MGHPIYHLEVDVKSCRVEIRLNDFPVLSLVSLTETPANFAPPINPWLVGELNILDVTIHAIEGASAPSTFADAHVWGNVRRFEKGDIVFPGSGQQITEFSVPDELREQAREENLELPISFTHVFENDVIDFTAELSDAPMFDDRAALADYAIHLRDLVTAGDVTGLLAEHEPKIRAWVAAYDEPYDAFRDSLRAELVDFVGAGPKERFERSDLELVPCCGARIWEVRRAGGVPLLRTEPDASGGRMQFPIFVAPREGALRIVR
jgi:hypothetical protein